MARKKRAHRRRKTMSEGGLSRRRRSTRRRRSGRGLSAAVSSITGSGKLGQGIQTTLSGFVGGYASGFINDMIQPASKTSEFFINAGMAVAAVYAGMPNVAAGVSGAYAERLRARAHSMSEEYEWANQDTLEEMPVFLDEAGNEMVLADDGNFYYMDEGGNFHLAAAAPPELLADSAPQILAENYLPGYVTGTMTA